MAHNSWAGGTKSQQAGRFTRLQTGGGSQASPKCTPRIRRLNTFPSSGRLLPPGTKQMLVQVRMWGGCVCVHACVQAIYTCIHSHIYTTAPQICIALAFKQILRLIWAHFTVMHKTYKWAFHTRLAQPPISVLDATATH